MTAIQIAALVYLFIAVPVFSVVALAAYNAWQVIKAEDSQSLAKLNTEYEKELA